MKRLQYYEVLRINFSYQSFLCVQLQLEPSWLFFPMNLQIPSSYMDSLFLGFIIVPYSTRQPVRLELRTLRLLQRIISELNGFWFWRVSSSGIWRRVVRWVLSDVSEEHIASTFRVEEIGTENQRASRWQAMCSSETSVETQRTTRRHTPEDDTLHNHRCENLRSYMVLVYLTALF
jgi:hypothetical protein